MSKGDKKDVSTLISDFQREIRAEIRSLKESLKFCSDTCDDVKEIGTDIKALRAEIKTLVSQNEKLKTENQRLEKKIEELEQYQRSNNLEIKGAPEELDSTVVVKKISELVASQSVIVILTSATGYPRQKRMNETLLSGSFHAQNVMRYSRNQRNRRWFRLT